MRIGALGVLIVLGLTELVVRAGPIAGDYFRPPTGLFAALVRQPGESGYWTAILHTLQGWAIGLAIAIAIAVPAGLALGFSDLLYRALRPVIEFLRPVPSVPLLPLAILLHPTRPQSNPV